jgi:hypothetical protein
MPSRRGHGRLVSRLSALRVRHWLSGERRGDPEHHDRSPRVAIFVRVAWSTCRSRAASRRGSLGRQRAGRPWRRWRGRYSAGGSRPQSGSEDQKLRARGEPGRDARCRSPPGLGPCTTDLFGGLDEHDLGEARQGLEFSVERDVADAIDAADGSKRGGRRLSGGW